MDKIIKRKIINLMATESYSKYMEAIEICKREMNIKTSSEAIKYIRENILPNSKK